jgi:hypothetical protein
MTVSNRKINRGAVFPAQPEVYLLNERSKGLDLATSSTCATAPSNNNATWEDLKIGVDRRFEGERIGSSVALIR